MDMEGSVKHVAKTSYNEYNKFSSMLMFGQDTHHDAYSFCNEHPYHAGEAAYQLQMMMQIVMHINSSSLSHSTWHVIKIAPTIPQPMPHNTILLAAQRVMMAIMTIRCANSITMS